MRQREVLVTRVQTLAEPLMAYPYKVWGYGESIGLEALLAAAEATDDRTYFEFVHGLLEGWTAKPSVEFADHVAPGVPLLTVYQHTRDQRFIDQAYRLASLLLAFPRNAFGAARHRPDHPEFSQYIYVDCMHTDAPFLCRLATLTGDMGLRGKAIDLLMGHVRVLRDESIGLFYHMYDSSTECTNGAFWGRGNGWAMLGLLSTLEALPGDAPERSILRQYVELQAATVVGLQDASGHWHTVLNEPETYFETSLAAFFCLAFTRAVRLGLLPEAYLRSAQMAWHALLNSMDENGTIMGVSRATAPGSSAAYAQVPVGGTFPWGHGPALLAAIEQMHLSMTVPLAL